MDQSLLTSIVAAVTAVVTLLQEIRHRKAAKKAKLTDIFPPHPVKKRPPR